MEFESNSTSQNPNVDPSLREEVSQRRLVVTPLHTDITPEFPSDEQVANQHILDPAIGNIPSDTEVTTVVETQSTQSPSAQTSSIVAATAIAQKASTSVKNRKLLPIAIAAVVILIVAVAAYLYLA